jgi:hypothetical protein
MDDHGAQTGEKSGSRHDTGRRGGRGVAVRMLVSIVLLAISVAGLESLGGAANRSPGAAHADSSSPALSETTLQSGPVSVSAQGVNFTPGGLVHIDLVVTSIPGIVATPVPGYTPIPLDSGPRIVASADVRAARTTYVSNGHGIVFPRQGGYFVVGLIAPSDFCGPTSEIFYSLVATDQTTGKTSTVPQFQTGPACG